MNIRWYLMMALLSISTASIAQLSESTYHDRYQFRVGLRVAAGNHFTYQWPQARREGVFTMDLELWKSNYEMGGLNSSHRNPFLMESFWPLAIDIFRKGSESRTIYTGSSLSLSSFILGWNNLCFTVMTKPNFNLAVGASLSDYFYTFEPYQFSSNKYLDIIEPGGWYLAAGPAVMVDALLPNSAWILHGEANYDLGYRVRGTPGQNVIEGYPSPHFFKTTVEIRSPWHFVAGVHYIRTFDRGPNNNAGQRYEFYTSYSIFNKRKKL